MSATSPLPRGAVGAKGPVVGVNLYAQYNYSARQTTSDAIRTLSYIKGKLHASAVDIVWNLYNPTPTASRVVTSRANTASAAEVGLITKLAQQKYHLIVEYRPMLFVQKKTHWSGTIKPANPGAWFASFEKVNLPYLRMAQKYHISEFVIATEMVAMTPYPKTKLNSLWNAFLAKSGKTYRGQISVALHEAYYFYPHFRAPATRLTGFDYYEKLNLSPKAKLSAVIAAYEKYFLKTPASLLRRTAIQETGIAAVNGAYRNPAELGMTGKLNQAVQYNWFIAGCAAAKRFHLRGIFFWKVDLSDFPLNPAKNTGNFEGRLGARAIAKCSAIVK